MQNGLDSLKTLCSLLSSGEKLTVWVMPPMFRLILGCLCFYSSLGKRPSHSVCCFQRWGASNVKILCSDPKLLMEFRNFEYIFVIKKLKMDLMQMYPCNILVTLLLVLVDFFV